MTEGDRIALARARDIMQRFGKTMPTSKALSGKVTKEEIVVAEDIAFELESLRIYNTPTAQEVEEFMKAMNTLTLKGLKEFPITIWVNGPDGTKIRTTSTLGEVMKDCKKKQHFIGKLGEIFADQKPRKLSLQLTTAFGRLKTAAVRAGLPQRINRRWADS